MLRYYASFKVRKVDLLFYKIITFLQKKKKKKKKNKKKKKKKKKKNYCMHWIAGRANIIYIYMSYMLYICYIYTIL